MRIVTILALVALSGSAHALTSGTGDNRAEIQAMIDATPSGGVLLLPSGEFFVSRYSTTDHALRIPAGVTVRGSGGATILKQLAGTPDGVRLIAMDGAGASLERITLDGNADAQMAGEHRAGPFITAPVTLRDVVARNFTGDGVYLHAGAGGTRLDNVTATGNHRNGVTLGWQMAGVTIVGGLYANNTAQQIDSEPAAGQTVDNVTITGAIIDGGSSSNFAITVSGTSSTARSHGWRVTGNVINGSIHVVWTDDVTIAGNAIANGSSDFGIDVYRTSSHVTIAGNAIAMTDASRSYPSAIAAIGTGGTSRPSRLVIVDNDITSASLSSTGVRLDGCSDVVVASNRLTGPGVTSSLGSALYARATDPDLPFDLVTFVGNVATGFGQRGIDIRGNGTARITRMRAVGNTLGDATSIQPIGVSLDDGLHPLLASDIVGNTYGSGVTAGRL